MRSLLSVLFLVIFCSEQMTSSATEAVNAAKSVCCGEFSNVKIPVNRVVSYYWTSSSCPKRAIVFKTIAGKEFCVDPETHWVSSHVAKVQKRTRTATEANAATRTATETTATGSTATETTATESTATETTATESTATETTSTESTAASTTAATAKTQSLPV